MLCWGCRFSFLRKAIYSFFKDLSYDGKFLLYQYNSFFNKLYSSIAEHKEQIEKAEEKERLEKEKEEKQKKEAEEKSSEKEIKADEDVEHNNEVEMPSHVEDNDVASNHDNIEIQEDSPTNQVWLNLQ